MKRSIFVAALLLGAAATYLWSQRPVFSFKSDRLGVALLRGRYRAWYCDFCDGYTFGKSGKMEPVSFVFSNSALVCVRSGYRLPKFHHTDMADWTRWWEAKTNTAKP